ncbi:cupin domain-containing protein [Flavihumibacter stibioxidans]|uniref:Cupin n=1 Tax=Flavihumibacter stibioxidans TaxID=1834163 RepID=A0ABR7MB41_9BACT|nr:cupin domain-containing protein [Flavihumibacter stibioxidans]MBC6492182.1 cupin [Flavihumibacter stibioxidans]
MQHLNDIPTKEVVPGLFGKFLHGDKSTLAVWDIKKGSILPEHHHENEQITYILEGELEMTIGGVTTIFRAGNVQVIKSNVPHSAIALTDCRVIDTWAPVREAYR